MRTSEIVVGPTGDISFLGHCSGPLKAGETVLRIEVVQPEGAALDAGRIELLRRQAEVFFSTLDLSRRASDNLIVERLKREVSPETWNVLLAAGSERAYWLIQAWTAETRLVLENRSRPAAAPFDAEGLLSMLARWAAALQFPDIVGLKRAQRADWWHVAANARAQADFHRRRAKHLGRGAVPRGPRRLLPRLRGRLARGQRLLVLGLKSSPRIFDLTVHGLLDRHAELVLADSADEGLRRFVPEISEKGYAAALILPDLPQGLVLEVERACLAHGLACAKPKSDGHEDLDRSLADLDSVLRGNG